MYKSTISLHNLNGQRKYLNQVERLRFLECTKSRPLQIKLFCQLLYYTGARIAEIHNLRVGSIDFSNKTVVIETLKKRKSGIYREIPLPDSLLESLKSYVDNMENSEGIQTYLWDFSLRSASRYIKSIMLEANIIGVRSCARGLRHGFAVHAVNTVPVTMVKKWLGHSSLETTSIYLDVTGVEEREIAKRIWAESKFPHSYILILIICQVIF